MVPSGGGGDRTCVSKGSNGSSIQDLQEIDNVGAANALQLEVTNQHDLSSYVILDQDLFDVIARWDSLSSDAKTKIRSVLNQSSDIG